VDIPHRQFSTSCAAVAALLLAVAAQAQDTTARSDSTSRKPAIPLPGVAITATAVDTTRPVLDTISAATGGSVGALELQALPSDERDPTEVAITVPGAARGVGFFDFAPKVSLDGASSLYVPYTIDGMDDNEGYLGGNLVELPLDAIQRIGVMTTSYGTDIGRSATGVIQYETRRGSDRWQGDVFTYFRPGSPLDATPPGVTSPAPGFRRQEGGGSFGGPLWRGHTYVFGAIDYAHESESQPFTIDPAYNTPPGTSSYAFASGSGNIIRELTRAFGRLDQQWSPSETTTLEVAYSGIHLQGQGGGIVVPEADFTQNRDGFLANIRQTSDLGALVNTATVQVSTYHYYYPPSASSFSVPEVTIVPNDTNLTPIVTVGSSGFEFDERETLLQFRDVAQRQIGAHAVQAGVDIMRGHYDLLNTDVNPAGLYTVSLAGSNIVRHGPFVSIADIPTSARVVSYEVDARPEDAWGTQVLLGAFVQDQWHPWSKATVMAGVRWDYDDETARAPTGPELGNVQPRVALNWRVTPNDVVRVGAGLYTGKMLFVNYLDYRQFAANGDLPVILSGSAAPAFGRAPSPAALAAAINSLTPREIRLLFARGAYDPTSYQGSIGYEKRIAETWGFSTTALVVGTSHLPRLWDLNADTFVPPPGDTVQRSLTFGDAHRPLPVQNGSYRWLTTTDFGGQAIYWALQTTLRHQFSDAWSADIDYTLSRSRDNTEDINFFASQGNDFHAEWADAVNDRRHRVVGRVIYDWRRTLQLGTIADFETGSPYNVVAPVGFDFSGSGSYALTANGFDANYQRYPGTPRNSGRLPDAFDWSFSAAYAVPGTAHRLRVRADVFNVLNDLLISGFVNNAFGGGPRTQVSNAPPNQFTTPALNVSVGGRPREFQLSAEYAW